ncbi:MAG: glycosyltransferase, partial [Erysipelotrichaceae bacterium]|nr:glycosyltransferase [Erysipelotrichaceae bacterium]
IQQGWEEKLHILFGTLLDRHGRYSYVNTKKIIEQIAKCDPDIVHLHNIHGFYLNYEMLFNFLKNSKIKVVWTLHDCWSKTGFCSHYDYNQCDGYKTGCKNCKFKNVYPYRVLSNSRDNFELKKSVFTSLDDLTIVTPSRWLKEQIDDSYLKEYPKEVIHNGIDTTKFKYHENDLRERYDLKNKKIALVVSSLYSVQKGLDEYRKLAGMLSDDWKLVMIGLSDKQIKELPEGVLGIQRTNSVEELVDWYSTADCLLNLSLEDVYPTVNIEAMSCGLPVIAYRTGGMIEQVEGKGILIDKYDIQGVCDALNTFDMPRQEYSFDNNMTEDYMKLYEEITK